MERRNKRRISHVGQQVSKKKCKMMDDVVTDIMNAMDANIADSAILTRGKGSSANVCALPPEIINQPSTTVSQRNILKSKRHPLMEKVQKNINYMKHNRRMPKPRAHLSGFSDMVPTKKVEIDFTQTKTKSHIGSTTSSDESVSDASSTKCSNVPSSSDSESEFESFIQSQKQDTDYDKRKPHKSRKRIKPKKVAQTKKAKKCLKKKKCGVSEVKSSDDETSSKNIMNPDSFKIKVTDTNRQMLDYTSDSSVASPGEDKLDGFFETGLDACVLSVEKEKDSEVEVFEKIDTKCTVRIERNPSLEETMNNQNNECKEDGGLDKFNNGIVLDSDDDCMIVGEVPKSDNCPVDTCVAESGDTESDIQILSVVSLKQEKEDAKANDRGAVSKLSSSSCGVNSGDINYEKLEEAIANVRVLESHANSSAVKKNILIPKDNYSDLGTDILTDNLEAVTVCGWKKETVAADIIETANKIDFKKILSLAKKESNDGPSKCSSVSDVKVFNSLPCSMSTGGLPSFASLPSNGNEGIPESLWQDVKKAVTAAELSENHSKPSTSTVSSGLNSSTLKEIIASAKLLTGQRNEESIFQDERCNKYQLKKNYYENSCDELDYLAATILRDLCPDPSRSLLKLVNLLILDYISIKRTENDAALGLKLLQDIEADKIEKIKTALGYILRHDPCFYSHSVAASATLEHGGAIVNHDSKANLIQNPQSEDNALSGQTKNCISCGLKAFIECGRCKMVFFCSEKCGVQYWENGHFKECCGINM